MDLNILEQDDLLEIVRSDRRAIKSRVEALQALLRETGFRRSSWYEGDLTTPLYRNIFYNVNFGWPRELQLEVAKWLIAQANDPFNDQYPGNNHCNPGVPILGDILESFPELQDEAESAILKNIKRAKLARARQAPT